MDGKVRYRSEGSEVIGKQSLAHGRRMQHLPCAAFFPLTQAVDGLVSATPSGIFISITTFKEKNDYDKNRY